MIKSPLTLLLLCATSLLWVSCASTPQNRVEKHPVMHSKLTKEHQSLVSQGRIESGMTKDAVYLALGKPENVSHGSREGNSYELWNYYRLEPVVSHQYGGNWGFGGRNCRRGGLFYAPSVHYIPKKSGIVRFSGGKVESYEASGYAPLR